MAGDYQHFSRRQKSNSVAANTMDDNPALPGRAGFAIVITQFVARGAGGGGAQYVDASATDGTQSSFAIGSKAPAVGSANNMHSVQESQEHIFGEGLPVRIIVNGDAAATSVGYCVDYYYRPMFSGFTGAQP